MRFLKTNSIRILCFSLIFSLSNLGEAFGQQFAGSGGVGTISQNKNLTVFGKKFEVNPDDEASVKRVCEQLSEHISNSSAREVNTQLESSEVNGSDHGVVSKIGNAMISATKTIAKNACEESQFCTQALEKIKEQGGTQEFQEKCEEAIADGRGGPVAKLRDEALANNIDHLNSQEGEDVARIAPQSSPVETGVLKQIDSSQFDGSQFDGSNNQTENFSPIGNESECVNKENCYFQKSSQVEGSDCDLLECSLASNEKIALDKGFKDFFTHMILKDKEKFNLKGDRAFCVNCLKKAYDQTTSEGESVPFEKAKHNMVKKVKNELAGRTVAKDLLDWVGHLELLRNRQYLNGESSLDFSEESCLEEVRPYLSGTGNPCGERLDSLTVEERMLKAIEVAKVPMFYNKNQFLKEIESIVDVEYGGQSCRKSHALERYLSLHDETNEEQQIAINKIFESVQKDEVFESFLDSPVCNEGKYPEKSFVNFVADRLAAEYADNVVKVSELTSITAMLGHTPKKVVEINDERCLGESVTSTLFCGEIEKSAAPDEISGYLGKLTGDVDKAVRRDLEKIKNAYANSGIEEDSDDIETRVQAKAQREFARLIRGVFNRPMKIDPNLQASLGSWENVCKVHKKSRQEKIPPINVINSLESQEKNETFKNYAKSKCLSFKKRLDANLCSPVEIGEEVKGKKSKYSKLDIKIAQRRAFKKLSDRDQVAANSFKCEFNSYLHYNRPLASEHKVILGRTDTNGPISDFESVVAFNDEEVPDQYRVKKSPYYELINQRLKSGEDEAIVCASDDLERRLKISKGEATEDKSKLTEVLQEKRREHLNEYNDNNEKVYKDKADSGSQAPRVASALSSGGGGVVDKRKTSYGGSGRSGGKNSGRSPASAPTGEGSPSISVSQTASSNNIEESSSSESIRSLSSSSTSSDLSNSQTNGNFQNLFGYLNNGQDSINPSYGTQSSANYQVSNSGLGQNAVKSASSNINCDADCVDQLKGLNSSSVDINQAADALGVKGIQSSSDDLKQMFSDVLDGKLDNQALDELREENKKLREEMLSIKQELETKAKPVKVLDSNGIDRSSSFKAPESNSNIVFNPRNSEANEFRSRSYYENKKDAFAPNYSDNSAPERVSLGEYSAQRRAASTGMSPERVKKYSGDIDRTFLQANSSKTVDDAFVKKYVEHVDKSSGSIEHLLVYENGRPTRIRVPDPDSPGEYIEQPIAESLVEDILEKVEKDEMNSYAVYNMVNFGQSLEQFMSSLETEKSNLTSLSTLNSKLDELRNMAQ